MQTKLIMAATAASLLAGTAIAQTTRPMTNPTGAQSGTVQSNMETKPSSMPQADVQHGISMAKSATFAVRFVSSKPADLMASKLVGLNVYNNQNEELGEIEDLVIDNGKTLTGVVVSVGGFLGMGERYVLIDPATIVVNQQDGDWKAFVDTSKDTLKNAPQFTYGNAKS